MPIKPADADSLYFLFDFNAGTGTAWWDDVALTAVSGSPNPAPTPSQALALGIHGPSLGMTFQAQDTQHQPRLEPAKSSGKPNLTLTFAQQSPFQATGHLRAVLAEAFTALDASTGNTVWTYKTGGNVWSTPAVANGRVYVGSNDFKVYALNVETGGLVWSFATGGGVFSSPVVVDNIVYVGSTDNNTYALDAATGTQIWSLHYGWSDS